MNEIGFAHHDIYRMKRKISAKIRLQSYIRHGEIISIINRIFRENEKNYGKITIPFSQERVLEYILEEMKEKWELVEIYTPETKHSKNPSYSNSRMMTLFQKNYNATTEKSKIYTIQQNIKGEVHELIRYFKPQKK